MRLRAASFALLAASLGALTAVAHADTVTYTFTGGIGFHGTIFTYVDTAGFLAFDTGELSPTTATDLFDVADGDSGPLTGFEFISSDEYELFSASRHFDVKGGSYAIDAAVVGESLDDATLTITDTPTVSSTPEPSSLMLLGTGVLSVAGMARRRFLAT